MGAVLLPALMELKGLMENPERAGAIVGGAEYLGSGLLVCKPVLPNSEDGGGGGPAGVVEPPVSRLRGGPAGVVEGFELNDLLFVLKFGVDGGLLDPFGTWCDIFRA